MNRRQVYISILCMLVLLVAGCERPSSSASVPAEKKPFKVLYYNQSSFDLMYGDYFSVHFPELEVEVVATEHVPPGTGYNEGVKQLAEREKPDLLFLFIQMYEMMAEDGLLLDLERIVNKEPDAFYQPVLDLMKMYGHGKVYGLSPFFSTEALYYNVNLFQEYGIPLPTDNMSWLDMLELAARFPTTDRSGELLFGYHQMYLTSPYSLITQMAQAYDIFYISADGKQITMDTPAWQEVVTLVIDAYTNGVFGLIDRNTEERDGVRYVSREALERADWFSQGKAAMTIMGYDQKTRLENVDPGFEWELVIKPINPAAPGIDPSLSVYPIMSIHQQSELQEQALAVIQYFHSDSFAKVNRKLSDVLLTRLGYEQDKMGRSLAPFYSGYAPSYQGHLTLQQLPASFFETFEGMVEQRVTEAVEQKMTVAEMLSTLQEEAQQLLDQAWVTVDSEAK